MDARVANGFLDAREPVFHVGSDDEIVRLFMKAIDVADREMANFQQMLAGIANYLLGLVYTLDRNKRMERNPYMVSQIDQARMIMHEHIESRLTIQDIAVRVGVGYSTFRKNFKKYTGMSPAAYFQDLRIRRAEDLLRTTGMPVKEIAYRLDFGSADYFRHCSGAGQGALRGNSADNAQKARVIYQIVGVAVGRRFIKFAAGSKLSNDYMEKQLTVKAGLIGVGLNTYWDQFDGLLDRLNGYRAKYSGVCRIWMPKSSMQVWWIPRKRRPRRQGIFVAKGWKSCSCLSPPMPCRRRCCLLCSR